jgi:hypothetical protein
MSGRKNTLPVFHLIQAESMGADITSQVVDIRYMDNVALQLVWTGDAVGPFEVQGSLDFVPPPQPGGTPVNAGTWVDLTLSPAPAAAGSADSALIDLNQLSFPFVRVFFDRTSGTGTLNGYVSGKQV